MSSMFLANPVGAFIDPSKGSAKNKAKCSAAYLGSEVGTAAATLATLGATYGLGAAADKLSGNTSKFIAPLNKAFNFITKKVNVYAEKAFTSLKPQAEKFIKPEIIENVSNKLKTGIPKKYAVIAAAAPAALLGIFLLFQKCIFKHGEISEKYNQRAQAQKTANN